MAVQAQAKTVTKTKAGPKMATFTWEGVDKKGNKATGELSGPSITVVKAELRKQGITTRKLRKKSELFSGAKKRAIGSQDITIFTRQLATMMKSGVPMIQAFEIVAEGLENPTMRDMVLSIKSNVEGGNSLASSIKQHPKYFDELFCSLVESGEQSGALETMLDRIAIYKEKTELLKQKIKKAIKYPIAVVLVAVVVTAILLIKVVPTFQTMFEGFGGELPAFTQMVINLSDSMQANWFYFLAACIGIAIGFIQAKQRSQKFRDTVDRTVLKLPVVGDIIFKATIARFARTLATTFAAGVPLVDALDSVAGATGNVVYRKAVIKIKEDVSSGTQLQFSMRSTGVFPTMAIQMVAIGEESGALDAMLEKVAIYYEDEVDNAVDGLTSLLEPIIMSVLGVLVGGLIIAMYLPIFKMSSMV